MNIDLDDRAWMDDGKCIGTDPAVFFPEPGKGVPIKLAVAQAKSICRDCPVRRVCLEYALANHIDHGVWGGMSERGRKALRAGRRLSVVELNRADREDVA